VTTPVLQLVFDEHLAGVGVVVWFPAEEQRPHCPHPLSTHAVHPLLAYLRESDIRNESTAR
jgi:hypothetical protein